MVDDGIPTCTILFAIIGINCKGRSINVCKNTLTLCQNYGAFKPNPCVRIKTILNRLKKTV